MKICERKSVKITLLLEQLSVKFANNFHLKCCHKFKFLSPDDADIRIKLYQKIENDLILLSIS